MSKKTQNLGNYDDVDFFGIDGGLGRGGEVNPMWGAVAGTGAGTLVAVGVTQFTSQDRHAELIGLGAALVIGGVMAAFRSTRSAGFTAMAAGVLNNGVRATAAMLSAKQQVKDATGEQVTAAGGTTQGIGSIYAQSAPALGSVRAQNVPALGMAPGRAPFDASQWGTTGISRAQ